MFCIAVLAAASCGALAQTCPAEISVAETLKSNHGKWQPARSTSGHRVRGIALFTGHPDGFMQIKPEDERMNYQDVLTLFDGLKPSAENEYWVQCYYHGTTFVLNHRVDRSSTYCSYERKLDGDMIGKCAKGPWRKRGKRR